MKRQWRQRTLLALGAIAVAPTACSRQPLRVELPPAIMLDTSGRASRAPAPRSVAYASFWDAVRDINLAAASELAANDDQRRFADALAVTLRREGNAAAGAMDSLRLSAGDTLVRRAARIAYGAILSYGSDWASLAELAAGPGTAPRDAAGVESWSRAFRDAPPERFGFPDSAVTLQLTRSRTGVPMIPVRVNGVVRHFWLDTGTSLTTLSSEVAAVANITPVSSDTLELITSVGRVPARAAVVPSIGLGAITIANVASMIVAENTLRLRAYTSPFSVSSAAGDDGTIDGIIGFDVIRKLDIELDYADASVTIRRPAIRTVGAGRARNLFWFGVPIVQLTARNGRAAHFLLDTGADETYATPGLLGKTGVRAVAAERRDVSGFGGSARQRGLIVPLITLFLDARPIVFERLFLFNAQYPTIFTLDGTLGSDVGRGGRVRMDMTNGRFELLPGRD